MYYLGWISLVVFSVWISLLAFSWGIKSGQFSDQARARYLPLVENMEPSTVENPARFTKEVYVLIAIAIAVFACILSPLVMMLIRAKGGG